MKGLVLLLAVLAATFNAHARTGNGNGDSLNDIKVMSCRWDPNGAPSSFLHVNARTGAGYSITGWNPKTRAGNYTPYREVRVQALKNGTFTIVVNGDVPLVTGALNGSGHLWFDQSEGVEYLGQAVWNPKVAGGPTRQAILGACWTPKVQKRSRNSEHPVARP